MIHPSDAQESSLPKEEFVKGVAVDPVIFGFHENQLKILIVEHTNTGLYALPGGFILLNEDIDDAAKRILALRTGLTDVYLQQFHVFGKADRNDPEVVHKIGMGQGFQRVENHWVLERIISIGYYALVDYTKTRLTLDSSTGSYNWYELENLPELIMDHRIIIEKALATLQSNLDQMLIGFNLLPTTFTMADLQSLYETILGKKLLRANFQRKMLSLDILELVEKKKTGKAHKSPYLYRFKSNGL